NEVSIFNKKPTGNTHRKEGQVMGVDYDVVYDFRSNVSNLTSAGVLINLDVFVIVFPIAVPAMYPSFDHEHTEFNSAVATKVVRRSGILESITQQDQGSITTVYNEAFDPNTGEALLTRMQNQYDDTYYNFSYPAYWAYDGMEPSFQNIGRTFQNVTFSTAPAGAFNEGDQLLVDNGAGLKKATIVGATSGTNFQVAYNDENASVTGAVKYVKVIRSGKKNILTEKAGQVSSMSAPVLNDSQISFKDILNAGGSTFKNSWPRYCECDAAGGVNPAVLINNKAYYPEATYVYVTERELSRVNNSTDLRKDGLYNDFVQLWWYSASTQKWWPATSNKWRFTNAISVRNGHGEALETVDYIGRYSSAVFGYAQTLPTAVATNTPYAGLAFDNFEAYEVENCEDDHFNFKKAINTSPVPTSSPGTYQFINNYTDRASGPTITNAESHSGKYSIVVPSGSSAAIVKNITQCPPKLPDPPYVAPEQVIK
ncbi:MAG TPA: hypothetical protein VL947_06620, partial [Cytophagales bacterium]|nr:hypothetical protein [Cytophagales bacterium]